MTGLVNDNPSLRGIMLGYVAEQKFQELIERHPHISGSKKHYDHDRSRKSDRVIMYKGKEFSIEVKSLQTNLIRQATPLWNTLDNRLEVTRVLIGSVLLFMSSKPRYEPHDEIGIFPVLFFVQSVK